MRAVLGPALDRAAAYCEDRAPAELLGRLFVNSEETPVEADLDALERGEAVARAIKDFGVLPTIQG